MSSNNPFIRALSVRDKRHSRFVKSRENADFHGLFTLDENARAPSKDEQKKIEELRLKLERLGLSTVPEARIEYAVRAKSVDGDINKAYRLLMLFEDSVAGVLKQPDPTVKLLGAENREKVTCYLDTVLFAMFARGDVFEAVLYNSFEDEPRRRLVTILRLWVNMLRTGRLITTDITQHLQEALSDCGWADAAKLRQQDASEAFGFITDRLNLPLVTLKTDLFHAGKEDAKDDHKFITERLLDVAIPENVPKDRILTLEECLEEYFNNRVEVKRELLRRNTASEASAGSIDKGGAIHVETAEIIDDSASSSPKLGGPPERRPTHMFRDRATSIFSERRVSVAKTSSRTEELKDSAAAHGRTRAESVKKEVLMPAWQFLNLIPWYTDHAISEKSQLASHFTSRRPMLGICLKRYKVFPDGTTSRLNTRIDIPMEMASPYFADEEEDAADQFKLVLQSVVCHRGTSVNAGHYVALARCEVVGNSRHGSMSSGTDDQQSLRSDDAWLCMDDLASERVTRINIQQALRDESPYLLFYRIEPIAGDNADPPPYSAQPGALTSVDDKLATFAISDLGGLSPETRSQRPSIEITSDGTEGRMSPSERRPSSVGATSNSKAPSIKTDLSTTPVTPSDEQKSAPIFKSPTVGSRSGRPSGEHSDKRLSSRIRARLSTARLQKVEVALTEGDEEAVEITTKEVEEEPRRADADKEGSKEGVREWSKELSRAKSKKEKNKLHRSSRRGSTIRGGGRSSGVPDRDCAVM